MRKAYGSVQNSVAVEEVVSNQNEAAVSVVVKLDDASTNQAETVLSFAAATELHEKLGTLLKAYHLSR